MVMGRTATLNPSTSRTLAGLKLTLPPSQRLPDHKGPRAVSGM